MSEKVKARRLLTIKNAAEKIERDQEDSLVDYSIERYRDNVVTADSVARLKEALTEQGVI